MDDFVPSEDDRSQQPTEIDSDSDFDIFSEKPTTIKQATGRGDTMSISQEIRKSENISFKSSDSQAKYTAKRRCR